MKRIRHWSFASIATLIGVVSVIIYTFLMLNLTSCASSSETTESPPILYKPLPHQSDAVEITFWNSVVDTFVQEDGWMVLMDNDIHIYWVYGVEPDSMKRTVITPLDYRMVRFLRKRVEGDENEIYRMLGIEPPTN